MSGTASQQPLPISSLGPNAAVNPVQLNNAASVFVWFVIIALIAWLILYLLKPTIVQKTNAQGEYTGVADAGKSFLGGLIIGAIGALLIWLFKGAGNGLGAANLGSNILLWFVVVTVLAWILLYFLKPTAVQQTNAQGEPTGVADAGKSFIGALLIGLLVALVIWLVRSCK